LSIDFPVIKSKIEAEAKGIVINNINAKNITLFLIA